MKLRTLFLSVLIMSALIQTCGHAVSAQDQQQTPTPTPGLGTKRTDAHGIAQVYIPAGCFVMGSTEEQVKAAYGEGSLDHIIYQTEQPSHKVCLTQGFWLDAYEVTNAAYQAFIDAGGYTTREYWSDVGWERKGSRMAPYDCGDRNNDPQQPRVCVTWDEAAAYSKWRGGRLPTEAEWEYASRGPDSLIYPWGNVFDGARLNFCDKSCEFARPNASVNDGYPYLAPVSSFESDKSWVGAYDLAGNAWEWVADWYDEDYYQHLVTDDPAGPTSGDTRVMRGGSWALPLESARGASRIGMPPAYGHYDDGGFRVVDGARPPSLSSNTSTATLAPTLAPGAKRTDEHGLAQVYVPAGCFMMGSDPAKDSQARSNEKPQHQVCITRGYWLDAYEVTNTAYQQFIDAGGYTTRGYWSDAGWSWKGPRTAPQDCGSKYNDPQQPRVCVSWYEAEAYAKWRGGRLPTEAEWEYAARGPDALIYPWGNTWDSNKLNAEDKLVKPAPVGSYESGKSWVGAYDMAGNVWEWVADRYSETYYQQQVKDDPAGRASGRSRIVRGGPWSYGSSFARAAYRYFDLPVDRDSQVGFRVVLLGGRPPSQ